MLTKIALVAVFGAAGALARFGLGGLVFRLYGGTFPAGTFVVNIVGCFLFGLVWPLAEERLLISSETRTVILIGFMGSFTTFSTLAFETSELLRDSEWGLAVANMGGQVILGLLALIAGMAIGKSL